MQNIIKIIFIGLLFFSQATFASQSSKQLDKILAMQTEPDGVVIEILAGEDGLSWALPLANDYIKKIKQRFPGIHIAIVSHGKEQFALEKRYQANQKPVHSLTESLVKNNDVSFHVCGTYASWHNVSEDAFPDYVDVAAAGPAQINDYMKLGYKKIFINRSDNKD